MQSAMPIVQPRLLRTRLQVKNVAAPATHSIGLIRPLCHCLLPLNMAIAKQAAVITA